VLNNTVSLISLNIRRKQRDKHRSSRHLDLLLLPTRRRILNTDAVSSNEPFSTVTVEGALLIDAGLVESRASYCPFTAFIYICTMRPRKSLRWRQKKDQTTSKLYLLTKTLGTLQSVATCTFLTAGRTTAHAAHTCRVTAWIPKRKSQQNEHRMQIVCSILWKMVCLL